MRKGSRVGSIGLLFVLIIAVALLPSCREKDPDQQPGGGHGHRDRR